MKKLIAVIVIAVVIIGAAYWLSTMAKSGKFSLTPGNSDVSDAQDAGGAGPVAPSAPAPTLKGPLGLANNPDGQYLTDKAGMTLYFNLGDKSTDKISPTCNATCEKNWPPFLLGDMEAAPEKSSDSLLSRLNLFKRADGKYQFAIGTQLLYHYAGDKVSGDMTGASVSGWAVARP